MRFFYKKYFNTKSRSFTKDHEGKKGSIERSSSTYRDYPQTATAIATAIFALVVLRAFVLKSLQVLIK